MVATTANRRTRGREGCRNIRSRSAASTSGRDVSRCFGAVLADVRLRSFDDVCRRWSALRWSSIRSAELKLSWH